MDNKCNQVNRALIVAQRTCDDEGLSWRKSHKVKDKRASARTQVYLSKTKLRSTSKNIAVYILKVQ